MTTTHAVAKLIRAELKQARASKEELAEFMDKTVHEVEELVNGDRKPTVAEGIAIAQFFDLDPMLFLGGK